MAPPPPKALLDVPYFLDLPPEHPNVTAVSLYPQSPLAPQCPPDLQRPHIPALLTNPPSLSTSSCPLPTSPRPPWPTFIVCLELGQGVDSHLAEGTVKQPLGLRLLLFLLPLRCTPRSPPRPPRCLCGHSWGIGGGRGPRGTGSCGRWGLLACRHTENGLGPPPHKHTPHHGEEGG